jgi:hypothetical protein
MHRCRLAAAFVGIGAWYAALGLVSLAIWLVFAVPFGVLLVFDSLSGEPAATRVATVSAWSPPREPVTARPPARLAA